MFYECIWFVCLRALLVNAALTSSNSSSQTGKVSNSQLKTQNDCGVPVVASKAFSRIVGGSEATPHSYPWQTSLLKQSSSSYSPPSSSSSWIHVCGGSIIGRRLVVTAAHCVNSYDPKNIRCLIGSHNRSSTADTSTIDIDHIQSHPNYTGQTTNWQYDIAILSLHEDITFNAFAQPICIPNTELTEGDTCVATGWGRNADGVSSSVLNEVAVPVVSWQKCRDVYQDALAPTMMCAGWSEGRRDTCQGDSGGPLVKPSSGKWFLYGITSVGWSCAQPNKPGIYTNVVLLSSWIRNFTNDVDECKDKKKNQCEHICVNIVGSYTCQCNDSYELQADGHSCVKVQSLPPPTAAVEGAGDGTTSSSFVDRPSQQRTNEAVPHSHPWLVSISYKWQNWLHRCSGCVIGTRWILASAACLHDRNKKPMMAAEVRVLAGAHRLDTLAGTEQELFAENSFIHPKFNFSTLENNIALLYLSGDIYFSGHIKPVCLPGNSSKYQRNYVSCRTVGWNGICDRQPVVREKFTDILNYGRSCLREGKLPDCLCARYSSRWDYGGREEDIGWLLLCLADGRATIAGLKLFDSVRQEYASIFTALAEHVDWIEHTRANHNPYATDGEPN